MNEYFYWFNYKTTDVVSACQVSASLKNVIGEDWRIKTFTYPTLYSKGIEVYQRQQDGNLPPVRYRLDDPLQEDRRIWPLIVK